jgi:asparagine synthase (glutamine-hydrolysing)
MEQAICHRGPDSRGVYVSTPDAAGNGALLAHRRLSILDLSTAADQPMTDPVSGKVIIFNGEIYNYTDLRRVLQRQGQSFQSSGDTAVLLRLLALQGPQACSELRGMFAFALWDDRSRELLLARDPLGIKPLYLARNPDANGAWSLLFASEVRSILASGLLGNAKLDPAAVASVLWNGFVAGENTIVRGVESLAPGSFVQMDTSPAGGGLSGEPVRFWSMPQPAEPGHLSEGELAEALKQSVRAHLASDVPLGVFLSRGIDSSAVANLAQQVSGAPIHTFTLTFEDVALNEGPYARRIAEAIGTQHREILLSESHFLATLDRALGTLDQPTFDGLNSFYMSQAVREAGLTVALVGTGGDELFGGYTTFRDLPQLRRWGRRMRGLSPALRGRLAHLIARWKRPGGASSLVPPQTRWAKLPDMVARIDDLLALYQLSYALFLPGFQSQLLAPGLGDGLVDGLPGALHQRLQQEIVGHSTLQAISILEQRLFLGQRLLRDSDAASMAVSLELRLPLVDSVLTEQLSRLGDGQRYQPDRSKRVLRQIGLAGLDPMLFNRPKSGFVLPFDRWIRRNLGQAMNDTMRDERLAASVGLQGPAVARLWQAFQDNAPGLYWSRVWSLYTLLQYAQRHGLVL